MTKRECAIVMAYTGVCMCAGENLKYFYEYVSELMGRPVYTHEFAALGDEIKQRAKEDFITLSRCAVEKDDIEKIIKICEQNEKLKGLVMQFLRYTSPVSPIAEVKLEDVKTAFGYDLDELLGDDWRDEF